MVPIGQPGQASKPYFRDEGGIHLTLIKFIITSSEAVRSGNPTITWVKCPVTTLLMHTLYSELLTYIFRMWFQVSVPVWSSSRSFRVYTTTCWWVGRSTTCSLPGRRRCRGPTVVMTSIPPVCENTSLTIRLVVETFHQLGHWRS